MKHLDITVRGRVQGVFFRACTHDRAEELGVVGTVRNQPDGSVFIEAEAEPAVLEQFVAWCRQGSPASHVDDLEIVEGDVRSYPHFDVVL